MKKVLALLIGLVLVTSCNQDETIPDAEIVFTDISSRKDTEFYVIKYEFEGHKYQFHSWHLGRYNGQGGPIHDPNCPCLNDSIK